MRKPTKQAVTKKPVAKPATKKPAPVIFDDEDAFAWELPKDDEDDDDVAPAQANAETEAETAPKKAEVRYSAGMAERICERIALGDPLQVICVGEGMPTIKQVQAWVVKYAKFREMYDQARILQADYLADEALVIVAEMRRTPTKAPALKAAADLLAKQAEWRSPRKYGPKMDLTVTERAKTPDEIKAEILRLRTELGVPDGRIARIK